MGKILNKNIALTFSQVKVKQLLGRNIKYRVPTSEIANVVYLYQCDCGSKYVGESSLRLSQRVKSHINQGPISSIVEHQENCETFRSSFQSFCKMKNIERSVPSSLNSFMIEKFKILKRCRN